MKAFFLGITLLFGTIASTEAKTYTLEEAIASAEKLDGSVIRVTFKMSTQRAGRYPNHLFYQQVIHGVHRNGKSQNIDSFVHVHKEHIDYVRSRSAKEGAVAWYIEVRTEGWKQAPVYHPSNSPIIFMLRGTSESNGEYRFGNAPAAHREVETTKDNGNAVAPVAILQKEGIDPESVDLSLSPVERVQIQRYIASLGFRSAKEWLKAVRARK